MWIKATSQAPLLRYSYPCSTSLLQIYCCSCEHELTALFCSFANESSPPKSMRLSCELMYEAITEKISAQCSDLTNACSSPASASHSHFRLLLIHHNSPQTLGDMHAKSHPTTPCWPGLATCQTMVHAHTICTATKFPKAASLARTLSTGDKTRQPRRSLEMSALGRELRVYCFT